MELTKNNTENLILDAYKKNNVNFQDNSFFQKMENIMKHDEVKDFFQTCFNNDDNAKTSYMYIGMYVMLENQIKLLSNTDNVEPKVVIGIIREFVNNSDIRHTICDNFNTWFKKNDMELLSTSKSNEQKNITNT